MRLPPRLSGNFGPSLSDSATSSSTAPPVSASRRRRAALSLRPMSARAPLIRRVLYHHLAEGLEKRLENGGRFAASIVEVTFVPNECPISAPIGPARFARKTLRALRTPPFALSHETWQGRQLARREQTGTSTSRPAARSRSAPFEHAVQGRAHLRPSSRRGLRPVGPRLESNRFTSFCIAHSRRGATHRSRPSLLTQKTLAPGRTTLVRRDAATRRPV